MPLATNVNLGYLPIQKTITIEDEESWILNEEKKIYEYDITSLIASFYDSFKSQVKVDLYVDADEVKKILTPIYPVNYGEKIVLETKSKSLTPLTLSMTTSIINFLN